MEATLPSEALIVKTIGDEVMIVSPDPATLTEWAVGFLALFTERPQPRVGVHYGRAVYRDGDYFGSEVNLAHRWLPARSAARCWSRPPSSTRSAAPATCDFDPIGDVELKGFPEPVELFVARARDADGAARDDEPPLAADRLLTSRHGWRARGGPREPRRGGAPQWPDRPARRGWS